MAKVIFKTGRNCSEEDLFSAASRMHAENVNVAICAQFLMKYRCSEFSLPLVGGLWKTSLEIVLKWVLHSLSLEEVVNMDG